MYHHVAANALKSRCTTQLDLLGAPLAPRRSCAACCQAHQPAQLTVPLTRLAPVVLAGASWADQANAGPYVSAPPPKASSSLPWVCSGPPPRRRPRGCRCLRWWESLRGDTEHRPFLLAGELLPFQLREPHIAGRRQPGHPGHSHPPCQHTATQGMEDSVASSNNQNQQRAGAGSRSAVVTPWVATQSTTS